jgi:hypothetical protein
VGHEVLHQVGSDKAEPPVTKKRSLPRSAG